MNVWVRKSLISLPSSQVQQKAAQGVRNMMRARGAAPTDAAFARATDRVNAIVPTRMTVRGAQPRSRAFAFIGDRSRDKVGQFDNAVFNPAFTRHTTTDIPVTQMTAEQRGALKQQILNRRANRAAGLTQSQAGAAVDKDTATRLRGFAGGSNTHESPRYRGDWGSEVASMSPTDARKSAVRMNALADRSGGEQRAMFPTMSTSQARTGRGSGFTPRRMSYEPGAGTREHAMGRSWVRGRAAGTLYKPGTTPGDEAKAWSNLTSNAPQYSGTNTLSRQMRDSRQMAREAGSYSHPVSTWDAPKTLGTGDTRKGAADLTRTFTGQRPSGVHLWDGPEFVTRPR